MDKQQRQLGPIKGATLVTNDLDNCVRAYCDNLQFSVVRKLTVSEQLANHWQAPELTGAKLAILASSDGNDWLRVVEDKQCLDPTPLKRHGWLSLETNVADVDAISKQINQEHFEVIGEPAYLQVSDAIKAMQVIGPAGEVSYLTQIERPVPPFELPMTDAFTGGLFIPVLATPDRDKSLDFYQQLNNADAGLKFDTKITVLNKAWDKDIEHQYPVATLQLGGNCLFEIDQLPQATAISCRKGSLPSGISMVSCFTQNLEAIAKQFNVELTVIDDEYYQGKSAAILTGSAGELIELIG